MGRVIELAGKTFGRLSVVSFAGKDRHHKAQWNCVCKCGNKCVVNGRNLRIGVTKSCGCYQVECASKANTTHGDSQSPEFRIWAAIITRCENKNQKSYKNYGSKGVIVCRRWRYSFVNFLADMGRRPSSKHTIERMNGKLGYCPSNCKWATRKEQNRNKANNRMMTFLGETKCLAEWAELLNMPYQRLNQRLFRGWSVKRTLTTP